jgi:hypothetical protein
MNRLSGRNIEPIECLTENRRIRLSRPGIRRANDRVERRSKIEFVEDAVQSTVEIGHHRQLKTVRPPILKLRTDFREHRPRVARRVMLEQSTETPLQRFAPHFHPGMPGGRRHHGSPPSPLGEIPLGKIRIRRITCVSESRSEGTAQSALLNRPTRRGKMPGVNVGHRLGRPDQRARRIEENGPDHRAKISSRRSPPSPIAQPRFLLHVKDFHANPSAAHTSDASKEWVLNPLFCV